MNIFNALVVRKRIKEYTAGNAALKLHIGCGRNYKQGWINVDVNPKSKPDLLMDIRKGMPFPDNSVDYVFNEHVIEHLSYEEGFSFLKESFRILKPGGVLRTAFPDLDTLIDSYQKGYWRQMEWVQLIGASKYPSDCYMLNACIREKGLHQYMYTIPEVKRRLIEAGFDANKLSTSAVFQSCHPELVGLERRKDSSVVEAIK